MNSVIIFLDFLLHFALLGHFCFIGLLLICFISLFVFLWGLIFYVCVSYLCLFILILFFKDRMRVDLGMCRGRENLEKVGGGKKHV